MPTSDQGVNLERYMLVPRTLIFLNRGDRLLLLKGARDKRLWSGLYNGIGGHIEQGEDILTAARRELLEETGLTVPDLWCCGISIVDTNTNPGVCIFIFKGECPEGDLKPSKEGALEWISTGKLRKLPLVSDLPAILPRIIQANKGDPPFSAHSSYNRDGKLEVTFG